MCVLVAMAEHQIGPSSTDHTKQNAVVSCADVASRRIPGRGMAAQADAHIAAVQPRQHERDE
jgi:hypothetical protein